jgi:cyanophycin synthetase
MADLALVEVRALDGANIFLRVPAIKLQVRCVGDAALGATLAPDMLLPAIRDLHHALDLPQPETSVTVRTLIGANEPTHDIVVAFAWEWRSAAEGIAEAAFAAAEARVAGDAFDLAPAVAGLRVALATDRAEDDRPRFVRDAERRIPLVGITGTNGKTTTTRCLAHILTTAGRRVGMANSNGVWIAGERVLEGDYTGPQGARRVLEDASIEIAVLETARGGILLRGIAYESNDVGVVTNISADHLGLQDIDTVEQLAGVKSLVVRLTRPGGTVVLNADDPLVRAMAADVAAPVILFGRAPGSEPVRGHLAAGGCAVLAEEGMVVVAEGAGRTPIIPLAEVPITFGGRASHMVENALAAAAAALGLGLSPETIATGLASFRSTPEQNFGRLHVFAIRDPACTFVVDYAHNEEGLGHLLRFGASCAEPGGRLLAIIGTAGDRPENVLRGLGRLAGEQATYVWIRETEQFLRGRTREEMNALFAAGVREGSGTGDAHAIVPDELAALDAALSVARPGDAIVMMCFEQQAEVLATLAARGTLVNG